MNVSIPNSILSRLLALCLALAAAGCSEQTIEREYGRRSGIGAAESVNGTATLATMYTQAGNKVLSWRVLSPKLLEADTIVWFPDKFDAPSDEVRDWLERRFLKQPNRTLIYVGRDFDAAPLYWRKVTPAVTAEQTAEQTDVEGDEAAAEPDDEPTDEQIAEMRRRGREAEAAYQDERGALPADEKAEWFNIKDFQGPVHKPAQLTGPWSSGVDPSLVEIELASNLEVATAADVLLQADEDVIASRQVLGHKSSELIVISNGSFLLNLPLVNHEHRKLAGRLIDESSPGKVIFLQSGEEDPKLLDQDPSTQFPTGMKLFFIEPWNFILLNLGLAGVIFCFARWPIFGVPREPAAAATSDFGRHVTALGEMLQRTRDAAYATARIKQYQQQVRTTTSTRTKNSP